MQNVQKSQIVIKDKRNKGTKDVKNCGNMYFEIIQQNKNNEVVVLEQLYKNETL